MGILQSVRELGTGNQALAKLKDFVTPLESVTYREGRGGQIVVYVTHQYVTDVLNQIAGFNWSNHILREYLNGDEIAVLCRLRVCMGDFVVEHDAWGGSMIARYASGDKKGSVIPRAVTDAYNAATSLAITKAASRLGIGLDLTIDIQTATMKRLHANGTTLFSKKWNEIRPVFVRATAMGRRTRDGDPVSSSRDLKEIEGRLLCHIMEEWGKQINQSSYTAHYKNQKAADLAMTLGPTARSAFESK